MTIALEIQRILTKIYDPIVDNLSSEIDFSQAPIVKLLTQNENPKIHVDKDMYVHGWFSKSNPTVLMGQTWEYAAGSKQLENGAWKAIKLTLGIMLTEDEMDQLDSENGNAEAFMETNVSRDLRESVAAAETQLERYIINPYPSSGADSVDYDDDIKGCFSQASAGTASEPADLNATAGTEKDLDAVIWTGPNQTANNVPKLLEFIGEVFNFYDVSATKKRIKFLNKVLIVPTPLYGMLENGFEILNVTTGERAKENYIQLLAKNGIEVVDSFFVDASITALVDNASSKWCMVAEPKKYFEITAVGKPSDRKWSAWKEIPVQPSVDRWKFVYERHVKLWFYAKPVPIFAERVAGSPKFYKPVAWLKTKVYH